MEISKIGLAHGAIRFQADSGWGWTEDIPIMIPMGLVSNLDLRLTSVSEDGASLR